MLDWFKRITVPRDQLTEKQAEALTEAKVERLVGRFSTHSTSEPARAPTHVPAPLTAADAPAPPIADDEPARSAAVDTSREFILEDVPAAHSDAEAHSATPISAEASGPPPTEEEASAPTSVSVEPSATPVAEEAITEAPITAEAPSLPVVDEATTEPPVLNEDAKTAPVKGEEVESDEGFAQAGLSVRRRVPPAAAETRAAPVFANTRVIVVASQKGGSGKTTLAAHLAVRAGQTGEGPAVLIDTDPQGSLTEWWHARHDDSLALETVKLSELDSHLAALRRQGAALVIIDTPPALTTSIEQVIGVADLVLVPARPSPHDLRAVGSTVEMIRRAGKQFLFVVNGAAPRANITAEAVAALSEHGQVAPIILYQRTDFAASMIDGRTVMEAAPSSRSTQEISDLWKYVQPRINLRAAA